MCGISGIFNFSGKNISSKNLLEKIINFQNNRGPDNKDLWYSEDRKIYLGHNRLSIIDLSKDANQPFISKDKNFVITFNGEIYNYKEIKKELEDRHINFSSNSDTEVIIEAYKLWGIDSLNKLRGMFSFAIYDISKKKLLLTRDPFGIKPLYYSFNNGVLYFASSARSLLSVPSISKKLSNAGLVSYYLWGHVQEQHTFFKEINSLEKGTCLTIDDKGNKNDIKFADIKNELINCKNIKFKDKQEIISYLKEAVQETTKYHMVSDVPVSFLLSSGIDSSCLVASNVDNKNCSALTIDFEGHSKEYKESLLAQKTCEINKLSHIRNIIEKKEIKNEIDNFYKEMDLPSNDGLNSFLVSKKAKKNNFKVIISGAGGDEFFAGYPSFKRIPIIKNFISKLPRFKSVDKLFKNTFYKLLKKYKLNTKLSGLYSLGGTTHEAFLLQRSLFLPHELGNYLNSDEIFDGLGELNVFDNLINDSNQFDNDRLKIIYLEIKYYLCSKLLRDCDWTSMANSVEMRLPFVDWFFLKKIAPLLKLNIDKKLLLEGFQEKLPNELFHRKKTGFAIPHYDYLNLYNYDKKKYSHSIKDWSEFSFKKYIKNINI